MKKNLNNHGRPWGDDQVEHLGTNCDRVIAKRLGRTAKAVETERRKRGISGHEPHQYEWPSAEVKLLGKMADSKVAAKLGIARRTVMMERRRRGIKCFSPRNRPKWLGRP